MSRRDIYYWKCDRPAAFHGTQTRSEPDPLIEQQLAEVLQRRFSTTEVSLSPGVGQGNHLTWNAEIGGTSIFIRVENGPEKDEHLAIESTVLDQVRTNGVPTPRVFGCDATRNEVPFAWQALERVPFPDLNQWFKAGTLDCPHIAFAVGAAVAKWQTIQPKAFGTFKSSTLRGFHPSYADYFHVRLDEHLTFLEQRGFLSSDQRSDITTGIEANSALLALDHGCLVHKDLALWNILGSHDHIAAFIDFDDAISGDPTDDLSLLACFHDGIFVSRAIEGYQSVQVIPHDFRRRFWLHLLRNMIVKAVIRVGAGYFERDSGFFLIGTGSSGSDLKRFTMERLLTALRGLREDADISTL